MNIISTTSLSQDQKVPVLQLWNNEYPKQLFFMPEKFDNYLGNLSSQTHYLLQDGQQQIVGWAFVFTRNRERWFAIILTKTIQGKGHGLKLLQQLKKNETSLCGWVVDRKEYVKQSGENYAVPIDFYLQNGFVLRPEIRLETGIISAVRIEWKI